MDRLTDWWPAIKWGIKSVVTLSLNLALLTVWVDGLGIPAELAAAINWLTVPIVGYAISDVWVFADHESATGWRGHARRYITMITVNNTAKLGNYAIYVVLIQVGIDYRVSWVIGAVAVFALTFGGNREVWRRGVGA
jgi:putative flippase GtrA